MRTTTDKTYASETTSLEGFEVQVIPCELMPLRAVGFGFVPCASPSAPMVVDFRGYRFQMFRVDTRSVTAEVVKFKTVGNNGTSEDGISYAMGINRSLWNDVEVPVASTGNASLPVPARSIVADIDERPESRNDGGSQGWEWESLHNNMIPRMGYASN